MQCAGQVKSDGAYCCTWSVDRNYSASLHIIYEAMYRNVFWDGFGISDDANISSHALLQALERQKILARYLLQCLRAQVSLHNLQSEAHW